MRAILCVLALLSGCATYRFEASGDRVVVSATTDPLGFAAEGENMKGTIPRCASMRASRSCAPPGSCSTGTPFSV